MGKEDITKTRRFALTMGSILIIVSLAGIRISEGDAVRVFQVPFEISKPIYIHWALAIMSFYSLWRYYYYAIQMQGTPRKLRKSLRGKSRDHVMQHINTVFPTSLYSPDTLLQVFLHEEHDKKKFVTSKVGRIKVRLACFFQDLDYMMPLYLNIVGLALFIWFIIETSYE